MSATAISTGELELAMAPPPPTHIAPNRHTTTFVYPHRSSSTPIADPNATVAPPPLVADEPPPDRPDLNPGHQKVRKDLLYLFPHLARATVASPHRNSAGEEELC